MHTQCGSEECTPRKFLTKEEKIERLKKYSKALESETKGVREKIAYLEKG